MLKDDYSITMTPEIAFNFTLYTQGVESAHKEPSIFSLFRDVWSTQLPIISTLNSINFMFEV